MVDLSEKYVENATDQTAGIVGKLRVKGSRFVDSWRNVEIK